MCGQVSHFAAFLLDYIKPSFNNYSQSPMVTGWAINPFHSSWSDVWGAFGGAGPLELTFRSKALSELSLRCIFMVILSDFPDIFWSCGIYNYEIKNSRRFLPKYLDRSEHSVFDKACANLKQRWRKEKLGGTLESKTTNEIVFKSRGWVEVTY